MYGVIFIFLFPVILNAVWMRRIPAAAKLLHLKLADINPFKLAVVNHLKLVVNNFELAVINHFLDYNNSFHRDNQFKFLIIHNEPQQQHLLLDVARLPHDNST